MQPYRNQCAIGTSLETQISLYTLLYFMLNTNHQFSISSTSRYLRKRLADRDIELDLDELPLDDLEDAEDELQASLSFDEPELEDEPDAEAALDGKDDAGEDDDASEDRRDPVPE